MSCQPVNTVDNDRLIARVYDKSLYLSDLEGMFPSEATSNDSNLIINAYSQRWVREALILYEAERNIPTDLNIDKLVRDYRASLLRHNYEQILVDRLLDSTIVQEELVEFYEQNKEQYQLETPIIKCHFIKVPLPAPNENELYQWWQNPNETNFPKLANYCSQYAESYHLVDSTWRTLEDVALEMPSGTLNISNVSTKRNFKLTDDQYLYYFKLFDVKNRKEIAPLAYIREQARKVILHKRKMKLLQQKKDDMVQLELERQNVEFFF